MAKEQMDLLVNTSFAARRILESAADFKAFGKAVHGSSLSPRLLYSSLMPSSTQSDDP